MEKIRPGDAAINIVLPGIDGTTFDLSSLSGRRYMVSFLRFATCPFCNLRLHQLVSRREELGNDFTIVAIFDSPIETLKRSAEKHESPYPILADEKNTYYRAYGVERSTWGLIKGMFLRMPTLLHAMFVRRYIPWPITGSMRTMPLDILVTEDGIVHTVYYGRDEGDHLAFEAIKSFSILAHVEPNSYSHSL
ncbi:MAG: hypothetical protein BMS9Abin05_2349 [Rhodothermia bacterium]|nr:MAG: hypothetical protein BMS9Abin05_2349 [Rhodothermia bacterium]